MAMKPRPITASFLNFLAGIHSDCCRRFHEELSTQQSALIRLGSSQNIPQLPHQLKSLRVIGGTANC